MASSTDIIADTIVSGPVSMIGRYMWMVWVVLAIAIIGTIIFLIANFFRRRKRWDITIRVRQEDNQYNKIYLDPVIVKGRRVTLSNGLRLIFLEKAVLGKRLFPLLNYHTRPGVYDLVITSDNRIFIITGIDGVDEQRKTLKVGIRYPGIDYSLEELNRDHAKLNSLDRRSDLLGIVKAASVAAIALVILVIFIVGGRYYLDGKAMDKAISDSELRLFEALEKQQITAIEQTNAMSILVDKMKSALGTNNLKVAMVGTLVS